MLTFNRLSFACKYFVFIKTLLYANKMTPLSQKCNHFFANSSLIMSLIMRLILSNSCLCLINHNLKDAQLDDARQRRSFNFFSDNYTSYYIDRELRSDIFSIMNDPL